MRYHEIFIAIIKMKYIHGVKYGRERNNEAK